jgi:hypothetical protein
MEATPRPWRLAKSSVRSSFATNWRTIEPNVVGVGTFTRTSEWGGDETYSGVEISEANAEFIVRAVNAHDRLVEALEAARGALVDESYGPFPGGDPRSFEPDHEVCTAEEIEAHRLACIAWDKGEGEDRGPSCATFGDGSAWTGTGYGVGTYTWEHDVVPAIDAALGAARGEVA